jgi:type III pantothenate kinase
MIGSSFIGVIDIGNSGLKAGVADGRGQLVTSSIHRLSWRYPSDQLKSPPKEWLDHGSRWSDVHDRSAIQQLLEQCRRQAGNGSIRWRVSSVQPTACVTLQSVLAESYPRDRIELIEHVRVPLKCQVDFPDRVGIDRLLAAWGANLLRQPLQPMIVIQAGTAITVDWLDEAGIYHGGAIMPGISLTLKYLALGTAHLPWLAPPSDPTQVVVPGRNTQDAILGGVNASFVGGIDLLIKQYTRLFAGPAESIQITLSGGDGPALSKAIDRPIQVIEHLVLSSLAKLPGQLHNKPLN